MPTRRQLIALGAASAVAPSLIRLAQANPWPVRTVHMVVPLTAGGPTDINARIVAEQLSKIWGQQVVIDNKAGGSRGKSDTHIRVYHRVTPVQNALVANAP